MKIKIFKKAIGSTAFIFLLVFILGLEKSGELTDNNENEIEELIISDELKVDDYRVVYNFGCKNYI